MILFLFLRYCKGCTKFVNLCANNLWVLQIHPCILSTSFRQGSGSACRSIYGGFVKWCMGEVSNHMVMTEKKPCFNASGLFNNDWVRPDCLLAERWWKWQYCRAACWRNTLEWSCNYYCSGTYWLSHCFIAVPFLHIVLFLIINCWHVHLWNQVSSKQKETSSTSGMRDSVETSPLLQYRAQVTVFSF